MKKVIFTAGTKLNVWDYLNDLQDYTYDNAYNLVDLILENTGVMCDTISGIIDPSDTGLKLSFAAGNVSVYPGYGITSSGVRLFRDSSAGVGGIVSVPGSPASGLYYIYAKYTDTPSDYVSKIVGFLYNPSGTSTVQTRNEDSATSNFTLTLTQTYSDIASNDGILLGSGFHNYNPFPAWEWSADARTPLRIKSDLLPYEVLRKYGNFANVGSFKTTMLGIQSQDESYTLWINNSGVTADSVMSASGLEYAYTNRHAAGSETTFTESGLTAGGHLILTDYNAISKGTGYNAITDTPKASQEFTRFFRHSIVNFDGRTDGVNDRRVVTTLIPSQPGTPTSVSGQLIELSTDSKFSLDLNAALLNYNLKDLAVTRKNEGLALVAAFYGEVQRIGAENGYSTMSGFYTYTGIVYLGTQTYASPIYDYPLTSAAQAIASGGYGISMSGLGWTLTSGANYYDGSTNCFVYQINVTNQSMTNEASSLERDRLQAATSVLSKTNRLEIAPAHASKQYRCRLTWTEPSVINNEAIKNYNIRIYKLNPLTQAAVPATPTVPAVEADFGKVIEMKDSDTYIRRKEYQTVSGHANVMWSGVLTEGGYDTTVVYPTDSATYSIIRVGDYIKQSDGSDYGSPYFVTKIINTSGIQLDRKFAQPIMTYDKISVYRTDYEDTTTHARYDFDIYADQYYVVYVRAVTEYDVAGPWSTAYRFSTSDLTNSQNQTLGDIVAVDELLIARTNEIKNVVFTQKLNSQIVALQKTVEDTPPRTAFDSLVVRVNQLSS